MYSGSPKHPIFSGSTFGLMSGEKPLFKPQVEGGHEALGGALQQMGLHAEETSGRYKEPERSYIIHNPTLQQMQQLGKMFGQESVVHSQNGQHRLVYTNGEHEGKYHPAQAQNPVEHFEQPPEDFYTMVPGHGYMRINFDWNQAHHLDPMNKSRREASLTPDEAAYLAKNAVAQLLAQQAPKILKPHPHAYEWHDGHTDHHQQDLAGPQLPGLQKAGEPQSHPHMDTPPMSHPTNEQAAPVGVSTYKQFALPYGNVQPGQASDLLHYKYHGKLPEIEKLVADHGFKTYYAGGKYGKPDLANKNYNTGHLMVYDPTPESGASFGHEEYTRGWRQIHELAHALTYPELNKVYGEGRRMGKLGTHRTLNEALRAVHWEWLAAHKQRELSKQIGVHLSDQDFNKELNTVMHDAAHRAVTGKFTEPSGEGFAPHGHHVPLHTALQMVRDAGHQMGLQGLHDTLKKPLQKSLPGTPPAAPGTPPAQPQMHTSVEGFMSGLKALPKGDPSRGRFITQHMHHAPFLQALQAHPQGKQIHAMLINHLNSVANAGPKVGAKVTMKSEGSDPIYSSAEGENPVADEKTYTIEEAREVLLKTTREKISAYAKEIEALRERELKKAVIQPHKHNEAVQASAGTEDLPPGKLNPKGLDKKLGKNAVMGYGSPGSTAAAPSTLTTPAPGAAMAMAEKYGEMCKACGEMHKAGMCKKLGKADLVSENGKRTENHSVAGSKDPSPTKEVNAGSGKDPGSGGIKLPGAHLKRIKNDQPINQKSDGKVSDLVTKAEPLMKPPVSEAQRRAMGAAAGGNSTLGIPKKVGKEFIDADKGGKLPQHKKAELGKNIEGGPKLMAPDLHPGGKPDTSKNRDLAKGAQPPMAKPPSGQNMGTSVPTSAPKAPTMKAEDLDLEKAGLPAAPKAQMQQHANVVASKAAAAPAPAAAGPLPGPAQQAQRAQGFQAAAAGAFQPKGPIHSGLEVAPKPAAGGVKLPGAHLGLKSPKAAGVTRGAMAPPKPAGPVMNAARPAAAKPGIFGKLFGKAETVPEKHKAKIAEQDKKMPKPIRDVMSPPDKATQTLFEDPMPKVLHPSDKKKGGKK